MKYSLEFLPEVLIAWQKIDKGIQNRLKKKLESRLENPHVESARLNGNLATAYKIKDNVSGYRIVYQVVENRFVVIVISVGKRERFDVYLKAVENFVIDE